MALQQVGTTAPLNGSTNPAVYDSNPFDDGEPVVNTVATTVTTTSPAVRPAQSGSMLASMGVELLESDWRGRPMISLKDGMFEDALGYNYGKVFEGYLDPSVKPPMRPKYAWQVPNGSAKTELAYVYELAGTFPVRDEAGNIIGERVVTDDMIFTNKKKKDQTAVTLAEFKAEMAANGKQVIMKTYYEVNILLHAPGTEQNNAPRQVSVSPTSAKLFCDFARHMDSCGMLATNPMRFKVGDKVKHGDNPAYFPWVFEIVT